MHWASAFARTQHLAKLACQRSVAVWRVRVGGAQRGEPLRVRGARRPRRPRRRWAASGPLAGLRREHRAQGVELDRAPASVEVAEAAGERPALEAGEEGGEVDGLACGKEARRDGGVQVPPHHAAAGVPAGKAEREAKEV